eukprot:7629908-Pyramimonas_sp.AAC.1
MANWARWCHARCERSPWSLRWGAPRGHEVCEGRADVVDWCASQRHGYLVRMAGAGMGGGRRRGRGRQSRAH